MCVFPVLCEKINVGRSLFIYFFYFFEKYFPDFNKKPERCAVFPKYYLKVGQFGQDM